MSVSYAPLRENIWKELSSIPINWLNSQNGDPY